MKEFFLIFISFILCIFVIPDVTVAAQTKIICIDPGHQRKGDNDKEPIAPGSKKLKAKVSSGTRGVKTKKSEYVIVLEISKKLKTKLEKRGYKVYMTRTKHDVNISNIQRAKYCNKKKSDLTIRVHLDGSMNKKESGIHILYPTSSYTKKIHNKSKAAAKYMLQELIKITDAKKAKGDGLSPRSDLTGFNWAKYPVILPELGFMSNASEDKKLSTDIYQEKLAIGIANGVDKYFGIKRSINK